MKLYLSYSTAGKSESLNLPGNLRHFDRYLQKEIDSSNFKSFFQELWITFAFSPLRLLPNRVKTRDTSLEWYVGLPSYKILRRYKKIAITIPTPEFSEFFDLGEPTPDQYWFSIAKVDPERGEIELAQILMDKLVAAIAWIAPKIRPSDSFNSATITKLLLRIKPEITTRLLAKISNEETDEALHQALLQRASRREHLKEKNKGIKDLRVCCIDLPVNALYPYDYQYSEIFLNVLSRKGLRCPYYHHLYINVGRSKEAALRKSIPMSSWYVYGITTIDYESYQAQTAEEQEKMVFELICAGLLDIAKIDHLDLKLIKEVIKEVKEKGLNAELLYKVVEHTNYTLTITYLARGREEECPIFFLIEDKATHRKYLQQIGRADKSKIYLWLHSIRLTQKQIKVWSSTSIDSDVWLKGKKKELVFNLAEIMVAEYEV